MNGGIGLPRPLERLGVLVADRDDVASVERAQVPDNVRAPVPISDHADSNRIRMGAGCRFLVGEYRGRQIVRGQAATHTNSLDWEPNEGLSPDSPMVRDSIMRAASVCAAP